MIRLGKWSLLPGGPRKNVIGFMSDTCTQRPEDGFLVCVTSVKERVSDCPVFMVLKRLLSLTTEWQSARYCDFKEDLSFYEGPWGLSDYIAFRRPNNFDEASLHALALPRRLNNHIVKY
jgi:hypothetical protein